MRERHGVEFRGIPLMAAVVAGAVFWCAVTPWRAAAESIVLPGKSGARNVVRDYGAKGDGTTDDTQALINALRGASTAGVYLPNGTYRVTAPLICNTIGHGPWIYGQSRDGVVIKLDSGASGFGNASSPQPVLAAHAIGPGGAISADIFFRQWRNFTVDAGTNAGAIGIRYYSNNSGVLDNVRITGSGVYGLDMGWTNMNGPLLVKDLSVEGFGTGIYTANGINSQTLVNITVRNSRTAGVAMTGQNFIIEDLTVQNVPTAVTAGGMLCLVNGNFTGSSASSPAIRNTANAFCRNITTTGFSRAIESSNGGVSGATVTEFTSESVAAAFTTDRRSSSLNLPIKKWPAIAWEEDTSKWVCVCDYGARPGDKFEDAAGFQAAIDAAAAAGKTTVYAPEGAYTIVNNISVHGSVRHLIGIGDCNAVLTYSSTEDKGFVLAADAAPVVLFSDFGRGAGISFTSNNTSTMVVENSVDIKIIAAGSGDVFINNCVGNLVITNPAAHVWARQWNTEGSGTDSDNRGGFLWILGLKTESRSLKIRTTAGGMSELLGAHIYNNNCTGTTRLFEITDAFASFASVRETSFCGGPYTDHVGETRSGTLKTWVDTQDRAFALYSGAPASFSPPALTGVRGAAPEKRGAAAVRPIPSRLVPGNAVFDCRGARITAAGRRDARTAGVHFVKTENGALTVLAP